MFDLKSFLNEEGVMIANKYNSIIQQILAITDENMSFLVDSINQSVFIKDIKSLFDIIVSIYAVRYHLRNSLISLIRLLIQQIPEFKEMFCIKLVTFEHSYFGEGYKDIVKNLEESHDIQRLKRIYAHSNIVYDDDLGSKRENIGMFNDMDINIIRNDDLDSFQKFAARLSFDFNAFISDGFNCLPIISFAAFYSAIKIFKFLLMNDVQITKKVAACACFGGNTEIIHLCESFISLTCMYYAVFSFHNDVAKWINIQFSNQMKPNEILFASSSHLGFIMKARNLEGMLLLMLIKPEIKNIPDIRITPIKCISTDLSKWMNSVYLIDYDHTYDRVWYLLALYTKDNDLISSLEPHLSYPRNPAIVEKVRNIYEKDPTFYDFFSGWDFYEIGSDVLYEIFQYQNLKFPQARKKEEFPQDVEGFPSTNDWYETIVHQIYNGNNFDDLEFEWVINHPSVAKETKLSWEFGKGDLFFLNMENSDSFCAASDDKSREGFHILYHQVMRDISKVNSDDED